MLSLAAAPGARLLKLFLLLVVGCVLYQVGTDGRTRARLARHGHLTQATVVGLAEATGENESGYYLQLRFATAAGATVSASSQQTYDSLPYRVGQPVALRYDPRDPPVCLTEAERTSWHYLLNAALMVPFFFFFQWLFLRDS